MRLACRHKNDWGKEKEGKWQTKDLSVIVGGLGTDGNLLLSF